MKRAFVRNRGLAFFIPGVLLLVAGILVIVSSPLDASVGDCLTECIACDGHGFQSWMDFSPKHIKQFFWIPFQ